MEVVNCALDFEFETPRKLSYSQVATFQRCPMLWYLSAVQKIEIPPSPALQFGVKVHEMLANHFLGKPICLESSQTDSSGFSSALAFEFLSKVDAELESLGVDLSKRRWVEEKIDIGDFTGVVDFIGLSQSGQEAIVIDWKTTSVPYDYHQILTSDQLTCYAWLVREGLGIKPRYVCYVTFDKKTRRLNSYIGNRDDEDISSYLKKVEAIRKAMTLPIWKNADSCQGKYGLCDYYKICWRVAIPAAKPCGLSGLGSVKPFGGKK